MGQTRRRSISLHEEFCESAKDNMGAAGMWEKRCLEMLGQNLRGLGMPASASCGHWGWGWGLSSLQSTEVPCFFWVLGPSGCPAEDGLQGWKLREAQWGEKAIIQSLN